MPAIMRPVITGVLPIEANVRLLTDPELYLDPDWRRINFPAVKTPSKPITSANVENSVEWQRGWMWRVVEHAGSWLECRIQDI